MSSHFVRFHEGCMQFETPRSTQNVVLCNDFSIHIQPIKATLLPIDPPLAN